MNDATVGAPTSPYKGLAPYGESDLDALFFFGRERDTEVIAANLVASRLTVLYGPSGVGKTSLLRAGVAQRLRRDGGSVVLLSAWSSDPSAPLRAALDEPWAIPGALHVILDQFEEYFLYHDGSAPFAELADAVRSPDVRANFLISIREDALAQLDAFKAQIPNLFANSLRLDRLDRPAARRAILGPLDRYNELSPGSEPAAIEDAAVEEILDSVTAGRIQLGTAGRGGADDGDAGDGGRVEAPYLQLVLERLWDVEHERGSRLLRLATLRELGGAERIVQDHLERAMAVLSGEERDAAAAMYNHLVTPSGTKIAHRAGDLARYAAVDEAKAGRVLDRLARERIVRTAENGAAGPQYEIFHDVLADAVLAWRTRHEAEHRLETERHAASQRHRRALALAAGVGFVLAVLSAVGVYALAQRASADDSAREARAHDLAALAEATLSTSPERSLALALDASDIARTPTVENALRRTLRTLRETALLHPGGPVTDLAYSPDGHRLAVATGEAGVWLYSTADPARERRFLRHSQADVLAFDREGRRLITAGTVGGARVWDPTTGRELLRLPHREPVTSAVFSDHGSLVATASLDGRARIWDAETGRLVRPLRHPHGVTGVDFNRDGTLLVTTGRDRLARVFDVRTGNLAARLRHRRRVAVARFAPTSDIVATGGADRVGRLWDGRTGRRRAELRGHTRGLVWVAFSDDGRLVGTSSTDATARIWNTDDGTLVSVLSGHINFVNRLAFSPRDDLVATGSRDRLARLFDSDSATVRATFAGHDEAVTDLAFAPDGQTVATGSSDRTVRIWDARPLSRMALVDRVPGGVSDVAFTASGRIVSTANGATLSPDGKLAAAFGANGRVRISDVTSGRLEAAIENRGTTAVAFSDDGSRLAAGNRNGIVRLWRIADAREESSIRTPGPGLVTAVALSPDRRRLLAGKGSFAYIWDIEAGRLERGFGAHHGPLTGAAFSPDGRFVVTTSADHDARLWDLETGHQVWMVPHTAIVSDAAFSADGRWVGLAGPGFAGVVDAKTGERILLLDGRDRILTSVAFSPSGWRLATGGRSRDSGAVRTYDCELCGGIEKLTDVARQRLAQLRQSS